LRAIDKAANIAETILSIITGLIAALLLIYSAYVLYDNFYTGQAAFASWNLLQYKPVMNEDDDTVDFDSISEINPDTAAWLTIYDTNINYPVVQGKDDLEYAGKDIYGKSSLTGSVYLSSLNKKNFGDNYNIVYGHHMDNGAMFGDIDKYVDIDFFLSHRKGELLTPEKSYELTVFACMKTNAYESEIYSVAQKTDLTDVIDYSELPIV